LCPERRRPPERLAAAIERDFGSYKQFAEEFGKSGTQHFGSGWLWLVADRKQKLHIRVTANADRPARSRWNCLLTIDLWEHSYYLDHQDRRREYLDAVIDRRLKWQFAGEQFEL
jgi:Fe-Mn family superoxide dismutase